MLEETEGTYEEIGKQIRATGVALFGVKGYSRIVFANGCFDLLHEGHLAILRRCRELAGMKGAVVVGLNSDASVYKLKGTGRPFMPFNSRVMVVGSLRDVDHVVVFDEDTPLDLIKGVRPDIIVKGGDYSGQVVVGAELGIPVVLAETVPDVSTSKILDDYVERMGFGR